MCGQIMEKFFCGETAAEIWANIEEKERHNFYPSSFCASAKVSSLRRDGTFIGVQKGTDTDQILEVLYNYPPDDPDTASAYASIVTLCVCEAHICTQSDIYSFLKKQIFHPTNPKYQILICILNV